MEEPLFLRSFGGLTWLCSSAIGIAINRDVITHKLSLQTEFDSTQSYYHHLSFPVLGWVAFISFYLFICLFLFASNSGHFLLNDFFANFSSISFHNVFCLFN